MKGLPMASYRDHPGMISEGQHQRLRNLGHYGHASKRTTSQPSKMAPFDSKEAMGNERLPPKGPKAANTRSIDENQREGSSIASKPTRGGGVGGSKRSPTTDAINQDQTPKFPPGGATMKKRKWKSSRKAPIAEYGAKGADGWYGGKNGRP